MGKNILIIAILYLWIGIIWSLYTYVYRYLHGYISTENKKWYNVLLGVMLWPLWVYNFIVLYLQLKIRRTGNGSNKAAT